MVLNKRERYVFLGTACLVVLLGADRLLVKPLLKGRTASQQVLEDRQKQLADDQALLAGRTGQLARWKAMQPSFLANRAEAENQILHTVSNAAKESGLTMTSVHPGGTETGRMPQYSFQAVGTGSMAHISRFLWNLQMVQVPLRITELQLSSRKDGTDDLAVEVRFSTLCRSGTARGSQAANAQAAPARAAEDVE
jgi:type II secretory pathway component PulM